ncbi:unnamed protein product [Cuscuta epithymum]|uniref:DUF7356 domain-containing protein n=1 Tax=Cuscuta epithymum TaxID=186058 RepID=A0AAV0EVW1_9ASTE|nr:unnamed protein product [Cuscuta epithymum]
MGKKGRIYGLIFSLLIFLSSSNASNSTANSSTAPEQGSQVNETISIKGLNESSGIEKQKPKETQGSEDLSKLDLKGSNTTADAIPPSKSKSHEEKGKVENVTKAAEVEGNESCEGALQECHIKNTLLACIQMPKNGTTGSKEPFLVLQNEGDSRLEVKIYTLTSAGKDSATVNTNQTIRVNIPSTSSQRSKTVVVDTGISGRCELLGLGHSVAPVGNIVQQLSLYSKQVTPIYGAYFLFLVALVFGGTWAACKLRKKKQPGSGGVPYQELEMGLPESSAVIHVDNTAEGWDQVWDDDDWDEDNAVNPHHRLGNISANGLTARSAKKDGWDNDWDD